MQKALHARASHAKPVLPTRRDALWVAAGGLTSCLVLPSPAWSLGQLDELLQARQPQKGNCATCIGAVDGTLGSCSETPTCLSSYDDRPPHFLAPWDFDAGSREQAMQQLVRAVEQAGASSLEQEGSTYLRAVFEQDAGPLSALGVPSVVDDVEFLFPDDNDTRVEIRSASRLPNLPDGGRQRKRLEAIRLSLGWEQVPILRNRRRTLVVIESPWDTFGPTPPADQQFGGTRVEDGLPD